MSIFDLRNFIGEVTVTGATNLRASFWKDDTNTQPLEGVKFDTRKTPRYLISDTPFLITGTVARDCGHFNSYEVCK